MKAHGLFLVYLGIESGTDEGLRLMDKRTSVAANLRAAACLKTLNIGFDYGFMLFDPSSTFERVADNLDFLDALGGDGSSPVTFCKMLPFAGTKIEQQLLSEGRMLGPIGMEDYHFHDSRLDLLYELMASSFSDWIGDHAGLLNLARWARYFVMVNEHYFVRSAEFESLASTVRTIVSRSNRDFTRLARQMLDVCSEDTARPGRATPAELHREAIALHATYLLELEQVIDRLERLEHLELRPTTAGESALHAFA
jgi:hypothetical protein